MILAEKVYSKAQLLNIKRKVVKKNVFAIFIIFLIFSQTSLANVSCELAATKMSSRDIEDANHFLLSIENLDKKLAEEQKALRQLKLDYPKNFSLAYMKMFRRKELKSIKESLKDTENKANQTLEKLIKEKKDLEDLLERVLDTYPENREPVSKQIYSQHVKALELYRDILKELKSYRHSTKVAFFLEVVDLLTNYTFNAFSSYYFYFHFRDKSMELPDQVSNFNDKLSELSKNSPDILNSDNNYEPYKYRITNAPEHFGWTEFLDFISNESGFFKPLHERLYPPEETVELVNKFDGLSLINSVRLGLRFYNIRLIVEETSKHETELKNWTEQYQKEWSDYKNALLDHIRTLQ